MMKHFIRFMMIIGSMMLLLLTFQAPAAAQMASPAGLWTTIDDVTGKPRSIVRIYDRNGVLSGQIVRVFKRPGDTGICHNCPGAFRNKPIQGLGIMWGLRRSDSNTWDNGHIIDPQVGKIYNVKVTLANGGRSLLVRGYMGISLLGRTQTWHRAR